MAAKEAAVAAIIGACSQHGLDMPEQQAYVLATVEHETAGTFEPVEECCYLPPVAREKAQRKLRYYPYFGRGYVQITWKNNYIKFGRILGVDLAESPEKALKPDIALFILAYGFAHGSFTGKRLQEYVRPGRTDYINARRVINGTDRAAHIAALAQKWLAKLKQVTA
jgi:predicted chitinase